MQAALDRRGADVLAGRVPPDDPRPRVRQPRRSAPRLVVVPGPAGTAGRARRRRRPGRTGLHAGRPRHGRPRHRGARPGTAPRPGRHLAGPRGPARRGAAAQLWEQGRVDVVRGARSLVLGVGHAKARLREIAAEADRAVPGSRTPGPNRGTGGSWCWCRRRWTRWGSCWGSGRRLPRHRGRHDRPHRGPRARRLPTAWSSTPRRTRHSAPSAGASSSPTRRAHVATGRTPPRPRPCGCPRASPTGPRTGAATGRPGHRARARARRAGGGRARRAARRRGLRLRRRPERPSPVPTRVPGWPAS